MIRRLLYALHINDFLFSLVALFSFKKISIDVKEARRLLEDFSEPPSGNCRIEREITNPLFDLEIIVPVYNAEKTLANCIESLLGQKTTFNYHVTVVNDGSTDSSLQLLKKYSSDKLSVIDEENGGTAKARNSGIEKASGKYLMFVDSDDILPVDAVENLLSLAFRYNANIVEGGADYVEKGIHHSYYCHDDNANSDYKKVNACIWGKVFSCDLFNNFRFPEGFWYEDTVDSFVLFPLAQRVVTCNDIVYYYTINAEGMTSFTKAKKKALDTYWITEECMKEYMHRGFPVDDYFMKILEKQIIVNCVRVGGFSDSIQKAVFALTGQLLKEYRLNVDGYKLLNIVKKGYFGKYRLYCQLH